MVNGGMCCCVVHRSILSLGGWPLKLLRQWKASARSMMKKQTVWWWTPYQTCICNTTRPSLFWSSSSSCYCNVLDSLGSGHGALWNVDSAIALRRGWPVWCAGPHTWWPSACSALLCLVQWVSATRRPIQAVHLLCATGPSISWAGAAVPPQVVKKNKKKRAMLLLFIFSLTFFYFSPFNTLNWKIRKVATHINHLTHTSLLSEGCPLGAAWHCRDQVELGFCHHS